MNSDVQQIKVISSRLLQTVRGSVHDHGGEILIQVTQNCEANRLGCVRHRSRRCSPTTLQHQSTRNQKRVLLSSLREDRISNAPSREGAVHAGGINDPRPLAAIGQAQVWREVRVHLQHPQACVVGVNGGQRGATHQGDGHCEIGRKVANEPKSPGASAETGQVCCQTKCPDEQESFKHAVRQRQPAFREILDDRPGSIDDEDERDQS